MKSKYAKEYSNLKQKKNGYESFKTDEMSFRLHEAPEIRPENACWLQMKLFEIWRIHRRGKYYF